MVHDMQSTALRCSVSIGYGGSQADVIILKGWWVGKARDLRDRNNALDKCKVSSRKAELIALSI